MPTAIPSLRKNLRQLAALALCSLALLSACGPQTPTTSSTGQGNLGQLTLPTGQPTPRPSASPVILQPSPKPGASAPASVLRVSKIMTWEVKPKGQEGPVSTLVGTVHAPFSAGYILPDALKTRIKGSTGFYMEADLSQVSELMKALAEQVIDTKLNMRTTLGDSYWQKLLERIQTLGATVPLQVLPYFKPWYLNQLISSSPLARTIDENAVMDIVLSKQAEQDKLAIRYLETAQDQFDALQAVSEAEYLRLIKDNLDQGLEHLNTDYVRVFATYNQGDAKALDELEAEARAESAEYSEKVVAVRTRKWAALLAPKLKSEACVVAAGAMHMAGPGGLASLLEAQGFEVSPKSY